MATLQINYFHLWLSDYSFGRVLVDVGQAPTYALYGVLAKYLNLGFSASERIIYFWPIIIITPISIWYLLKPLISNEWAKLIGVSVYCFNTYILLLQGGDVTLGAAWAFTPLVLALYIQTINNFSIKKAVITGIVGAICSAYEPRVFYLTLIILFIYTIYEMSWALLLSPSKNGFKRSLIIGCKSSLPIVIMVLLDAFWIIGLASVNGSVGQNVISNTLWGNQYYNINEALTLFEPFWLSPGGFKVQPIPIYAWIIPISAVSGLWFNRKKRMALFFGIIAILGILLTKQSGEPFPNLYTWLFHNFPGFNAFREASKFYGLIALGYSVLIAYLFEYLFKNYTVKKLGKVTVYGFAFIILLIFTFNLYPQGIHGNGNLFISRSIPSDYQILEKFLDSDNSFSRTYWLPSASRWGFYSSTHPKVSDTDNAFNLQTSNTVPSQSIGSIFTENYAESLFNDGSIKYVIVPLRDVKNEDDFFYNQDRNSYISILNKIPWLHKINIGTKEVAIYENENYGKYFSSVNSVTSIPSFTDTQDYYNFQSTTLNNSHMNFIENSSTLSSSTKLSDIFDTLSPNNLKSSEASYSTSLNSNDYTNDLYVSNNYSTYSYKTSSGVLSLFSSEQDDISFNGLEPDNSTVDLVKSFSINPSYNYVFSNGNNLFPISTKEGESRNIGSVDNSFNIYSQNKQNLLSNGSFENGLWTKNVQDCNDFDNKPAINQFDVSYKSTNGKHSLGLLAINHTACTTSPPVNVSSGANYSLSYDYYVDGGQETKYELVFNDPKHTVLDGSVSTKGGAWQNNFVSFVAPNGATQLNVKLLSIPDSTGLHNEITYYDNVKVNSLTNLANISQKYVPTYKKYQLTGNTLSVKVKDPAYNLENLIQNPSLENGLWNKKVGDCNAYNNQPKLKMFLSNNALSGKKSLDLQALRHVACTGPPEVNVLEGSQYLLSFGYQSDNNSPAYFSLNYDDPSHTSISQNITINDSKWHVFNKIFSVPYGATHVTLTFYSYSDEFGDKYSDNKYDSIYFTQVPDLLNRYYLVSSPLNILKQPEKIDYKSDSPTQKSINIYGASTGFYLKMSEAYNTNWALSFKLYPNIKISDASHLNINNFENGWYIDVNKYCIDQKFCSKNPNGSFNLELEAAFLPEKNFNIGLLISGVTALSTISYILIPSRIKLIKMHKLLNRSSHDK